MDPVDPDPEHCDQGFFIPGFADTTGSRQRFTNRAIKNKNKKINFDLVCPHKMNADTNPEMTFFTRTKPQTEFFARQA